MVAQAPLRPLLSSVVSFCHGAGAVGLSAQALVVLASVIMSTLAGCKADNTSMALGHGKGPGYNAVSMCELFPR